MTILILLFFNFGQKEDWILHTFFLFFSISIIFPAVPPTNIPHISTQIPRIFTPIPCIPTTFPAFPAFRLLQIAYKL